MKALPALALLALVGCRARAAPPAEDKREGAIAAATLTSGSVRREPAGPIRMGVLDAAAKPPMFVMRGEPRGPARLVFLHGMCGHGLGYAQAFQWNAAKKGTLIAPQGDVSCGGVFSKWSQDIAALDARILEAFRALGDANDTAEITIMGMSQGADRAVQVAKRFPQRYTRLVSMAAPSTVTAGQLRHLRGAVMMAGERDRRDLMQASARALSAAGVRATFMLIPQASHGAMGPTPEQTMGAALDWLWAP
jgi:pimeloyl-ACP methyl ester carboxylesterase